MYISWDIPKNMQIFQWLFKAAREQESATGEMKSVSDYESNSKDIVLHKHQGKSERTRRGKPAYQKFKPFAILHQKDVGKACFCSTINLRRLGSFNRRQHWKVHRSGMKKEDIAQLTQKATEPSGSHAGNKVLPITDSNTTASSSSSCDKPVGEKEKDKEMAKGDKAKAMSRTKEILRWATAAKTENRGKFIGPKVLHLRNRSVTLKAIPDNDQLSNESPKISFRWDIESCSTTSWAYSAFSIASSSRIDQIGRLLDSASRKGNWITTDSEFVVLEL